MEFRKIFLILLQYFTLLLANRTHDTSDELNYLVDANTNFGLKININTTERDKGNEIFSPLSISLSLEMTPLGAKENLVASSQLDKIVGASNDFGLELFRKLKETKKDNIIFSPLSISVALAMISLGARGEALQEIRRAMFMSNLTEEEIKENFKQITGLIPRSEMGTEVILANKLYASEEINPSFINSSQNYFASELETVNFGNMDNISSIINNWTSQKTKDKIKDITRPGDFNVNTVLFLVNALYFENQWASPFSNSLTISQSFYIKNSTEPIQTPFLHDPRSKAFHGIHTAPDFEVLEKEFKSPDFRFGIIRPNLPKTSLQEVENKLSAEMLKRITLRPITANLSIPKFKMESSFDLKTDLAKVGIRLIFLPDRADLNGIMVNSYVSKTLHKTVFEIDENGVVAAAATAIQVATRGPTVNFRVDNPFLFYIKHVNSSSLLFFGRFSQPSLRSFSLKRQKERPKSTLKRKIYYINKMN